MARLLSMAVGLFVSYGPCVDCVSADDKSDFFERKIRPVLVKHCYECHSGEADLIQGGLRLDYPDSMLKGGDSGAAVMPGAPDESLLLTAIRYDKLEMPPDGPLDERIVRDFEKWIELGAIDPRQSDSTLELEPSSPIDWSVAKQFWSFQTPSKHAVPKSADSSWTRTKIDGFVSARLQEAGLKPNSPAARNVLIRRLTFDLTGLPPTIAEVDAFVDDDRPGAIERVVDRLLGSPAHAERWTRLWLDIARFAEDQAHKVGNNNSLTYPNAYLYRNWVAESLAADMPYDEFIRMQLAADLIAPNKPETHVALGFLGLGPKYYRRNDPEVMADEWEDRIDTVSRGLLGLTVACSRCHDHKFDPIPTSDYYAMAGVFAGTEMYNRPFEGAEIGKNGEPKNLNEAVHIVREGKPVDLNVMIRGDVNKRGPAVRRAFLQVLSPDTPDPFLRGSGREDLADAIVDTTNPITARVIVNRIWAQLIGRPLVKTQSNFGQLGDSPSHPLLLDDLSVRFMENGWSLKWLQREIVLSATYAQSSNIDAAKASVDSDNKWLWRMPRKRLSIESYRDALLAASKQLDREFGGKSIRPDDPDSNKRTLYSGVSRLSVNPILARFDFPDPNAHSSGRYETTTPLQKLYLLNSPFWIAQSERFARLVLQESESDEDRIQSAYKQVFAREPNAKELRLAKSYVKNGGKESWSRYMQTLLISNEMFIID